MNDRVQLILRNPTAPSETLEIFLDLLPIPLAKRWVQSLKSALQRNHILEKHTSFLGFLGGSRDKTFLSTQINGFAEEISNYLSNEPWNKPYVIKTRADLQKIDLKILNDFHHHFEILMGSTFQLSPYYENASPKIRHAITQLNYLVHELEAYHRSEINFSKNQKTYPFSLINFLEKDVHRFPLEEEDYKNFSLKNAFGDVQIAYCQLGKTPYEAWRDDDENIFDENINGIQFYSANFNIRWGHSSDQTTQEKTIIEPFYQWLTQKGVDASNEKFFLDKNGKKHGLGFLTIGKVNTDILGTKDVNQIQDLISKHCDIFKIRIHEGGEIMEKTYDYFLAEKEYSQLILSKL
jgi:hypothetical protein